MRKKKLFRSVMTDFLFRPFSHRPGPPSLDFPRSLNGRERNNQGRNFALIVVGEAKYSSFLCSSLGRASSSSSIRARAGGKRYRTLVPPTFLEERKEREAIANGRGGREGGGGEREGGNSGDNGGVNLRTAPPSPTPLILGTT